MPYAPYQLPHFEHRPLDARLRVRVVILNALQQPAQTPVAVGLNVQQGCLGQRTDLKVQCS